MGTNAAGREDGTQGAMGAATMKMIKETSRNGVTLMPSTSSSPVPWSMVHGLS
jgi:hypothetical protein